MALPNTLMLNQMVQAKYTENKFYPYLIVILLGKKVKNKNLTWQDDIFFIINKANYSLPASPLWLHLLNEYQ